MFEDIRPTSLSVNPVNSLFQPFLMCGDGQKYLYILTSIQNRPICMAPTNILIYKYICKRKFSLIIYQFFVLFTHIYVYGSIQSLYCFLRIFIIYIFIKVNCFSHIFIIYLYIYTKRFSILYIMETLELIYVTPQR